MEVARFIFEDIPWLSWLLVGLVGVGCLLVAAAYAASDLIKDPPGS